MRNTCPSGYAQEQNEVEQNKGDDTADDEREQCSGNDDKQDFDDDGKAGAQPTTESRLAKLPPPDRQQFVGAARARTANRTPHLPHRAKGSG